MKKRSSKTIKWTSKRRVSRKILIHLTDAGLKLSCVTCSIVRPKKHLKMKSQKRVVTKTDFSPPNI